MSDSEQIDMNEHYADNETDIQSELRKELLNRASGKSRQKPWNLVGSISESRNFTEDDIRLALKQMMLEGDLEIVSTGEVRATTTTDDDTDNERVNDE